MADNSTRGYSITVWAPVYWESSAEGRILPSSTVRKKIFPIQQSQIILATKV